MKKIIVFICMFLLIFFVSAQDECEEGTSGNICERHNCDGNWACIDNNPDPNIFNGIKILDYGSNCEIFESCIVCSFCGFDSESEEMNWGDSSIILALANKYPEDLKDNLWRLESLSVLNDVAPELFYSMMKEKYNVELDIGDDFSAKLTQDGHLTSDFLRLDINLNNIFSPTPDIKLLNDGFMYGDNKFTDLENFGNINIEINFESAFLMFGVYTKGIKLRLANGVEMLIAQNSETNAEYMPPDGISINGPATIKDNSGFVIGGSTEESNMDFTFENGKLSNIKLTGLNQQYSINGVLDDGRIFAFKGGALEVDFMTKEGSLMGSSSSLNLGGKIITGNEGRPTYIYFGTETTFDTSTDDSKIWVGENGDTRALGYTEFRDEKTGFYYKGLGNGVIAYYNQEDNEIYIGNYQGVENVAIIGGIVNGDKNIEVFVTRIGGNEYRFESTAKTIKGLSEYPEFDMDHINIFIDANNEYKIEVDEYGNILETQKGSNTIKIESEENANTDGNIPSWRYCCQPNVCIEKTERRKGPDGNFGYVTNEVVVERCENHCVFGKCEGPIGSAGPPTEDSPCTDNSQCTPPYECDKSRNKCAPSPPKTTPPPSGGATGNNTPTNNSGGGSSNNSTNNSAGASGSF